MDEDPRVLVVDDDEDLRELEIRVVKQAGYQVDAVGDGQAGLERLAERAYDVILSDVRMPGMDGIAFYQEVRRRHPPQADRIHPGDRARPARPIQRVHADSPRPDPSEALHAWGV
jgi:CheY-like chemotaxis protein